MREQRKRSALVRQVKIKLSCHYSSAIETTNNQWQNQGVTLTWECHGHPTNLLTSFDITIENIVWPLEKVKGDFLKIDSGLFNRTMID